MKRRSVLHQDILVTTCAALLFPVWPSDDCGRYREQEGTARTPSLSGPVATWCHTRKRGGGGGVAFVIVYTTAHSHPTCWCWWEATRSQCLLPCWWITVLWVVHALHPSRGCLWTHVVWFRAHACRVCSIVLGGQKTIRRSKEAHVSSSSFSIHGYTADSSVPEWREGKPRSHIDYIRLLSSFHSSSELFIAGIGPNIVR